MIGFCTLGQAALADRLRRKGEEIRLVLDARYPGVQPDQTFPGLLTTQFFTPHDLPRLVVAQRKYLVGPVFEELIRARQLEEAMRDLGEAIALRWHPALRHTRANTAT